MHGNIVTKVLMLSLYIIFATKNVDAVCIYLHHTVKQQFKNSYELYISFCNSSNHVNYKYKFS